MEVSLEVQEGLQRRLTVQVPPERVDGEIQTRLKTLARQARIDGFRPGKVPMSVIRQRFGDQVRAEVMGELMRTSFEEAVAQQQVRPASPPQIEPIEDLGDGSLKFAAIFDVYPEVTLGDLGALKVARPVVDISDEDVDGMVETLRKQRATWTDVERAAASGDRVVIGFRGTIDGEPFDGNEASNFPLELGSGSMIGGFEEQLEGVSAGDKRTVKVTFPEDYHAESLRGKEASFEVDVASVAEANLPEVGEELFQAFGVQEGGEEAFRSEIRSNMSRELNDRIRDRVKRQVMDGMAAQCPIDVPQALVEDEANNLAGHRANAGMPEAPREQLVEEAHRRVQLGMILSEVVKQHNLTVDPERVRNKIEDMAQAYEDPAEVVQWYYSNREKLAEVESTVIEDQFVDWVLEQCSVEDTPSAFSEVMAQV